jgi:hypothetical protein
MTPRRNDVSLSDCSEVLRPRKRAALLLRTQCFPRFNWCSVESHTTVTADRPSPEIAWAEGLLAQTRAVLAKAEAGQANLALDDLTQLRQTERDLVDLLAALDSDGNH